MAQTPENEFETLLTELIRRETTNRLAAYRPYPFQKAWHNAKGHDTDYPARQKALMAGNQCLGGDTIVSGRKIKDWKTGFRITAWSKHGREQAQADRPTVFPPAQIYRLHLSDGSWLDASAGHNLYCNSGAYVQLGALLPTLLGSNSAHVLLAHAQDDPRYSQRVPDYQDGYFVCCHPYDAPPLRPSAGAQASETLSSGVLGFSRFSGRPGAAASRSTHSRPGPASVRLSSSDARGRFWGRCAAFLNQVACRLFEPMSQRLGVFEQPATAGAAGLQSITEACFPKTHGEKQLNASFGLPCSIDGNTIVAIELRGIQPIYDFHVPIYENYILNGLLHHNTGKTEGGVYECAIHATGLYPDWWEGERFPHAVNILMAGVSADRVRDTLQAKLLGDPHRDTEYGTGAIPLDKLDGKPVRKQGYVNAVDSVGVKHVSGGISRIQFLAYEMGPRKFMSTGFHVVHFDEEPPQDIYSQGIRAVTATNGIINLTFTPEEGVTQVVDMFMNEHKAGQALVAASWDDAPHIANNPKHKEQLLSALPPHEREMRSKGIPQMGSGMVFPVLDEMIMTEPREIPGWWPRIAAIDFGGFEHPFAAVWIAIDRDTDTAYIYKTYKNMGSLAIHCDALRRQGCDWIPTAWPHDVGVSDKRSGKPLAEIMRDEYGLNMLWQVFSNPPSPGEKEGQGGQGVEIGLWNILTAMETGRFKVFNTEAEWFREKGLYHRKDGKIVKRMDDLMDATRYAYQSQRFADVRPVPVSHRHRVPAGARNW